MKKNIQIISAGTILTVILVFAGCSASQKIEQKPGALLWGENCIRCHNGPSPNAFSDVEWDTIGQHMRVRANLNADEVEKIVEFLQMANK